MARIDVIVANAGIAHKTPLAALTDEKWDHTFEIDLKGIFRVVRPALAGMRSAQEGRDRLRLLDHGRRLWLGRARPLFLGEGRRRRNSSAAWRSNWPRTASA